MAQVSGMAVEVFLGEAVPNPTAAKPSFFSNTATLPIIDTPPPTGNIVVPNSPTGASTAANNFTNGFNYINSETCTTSYLTALAKARNDQIGWSGVDVYNPPTPPGLNIAQTIPNAPSGTFAQAGLPAISNVSAISSSFGDIAASQIQLFKWT